MLTRFSWIILLPIACAISRAEPPSTQPDPPSSPREPALHVTAGAGDAFEIAEGRLTYAQLVERAKKDDVASVVMEKAEGLQRVCTAVLGFEVGKPAFLVENGGTWPATWEDSGATDGMKRNCRHIGTTIVEPLDQN